jgi:hypothetical protein
MSNLKTRILSAIAVMAVIAGLSVSFASSATATTTVGAGRYENTDASITYTGTGWVTGNTNSSDSGGSQSNSNTGTDSASLTFEGTGIEWISRMAPGSGVGYVYLDGVFFDSIDRYSPTVLYQQRVFRHSWATEGVHTIKIVRSGTSNPSATGASIILDAFNVIGTAPTEVTLTSGNQGVDVGWTASTDPYVTGYNIYRSKGAGLPQTLIGTVDSTVHSFRDVEIPATSATYTYSLNSNYLAAESPHTADSATITVAAVVPDYATFADCPAATSEVSSGTALQSALTAAGPGSVILLDDHTYNGTFTISGKAGTAEDPIWICGSRDAVLNGTNNETTSLELSIQMSSYVIVTGFTVTNALRGVVVDQSSHISLTDLVVNNTGQEGVHLRNKTTDSLVAGNEISDTGQVRPDFGEGVYVGTYYADWCYPSVAGQYAGCAPGCQATLTCEADRSNDNVIAENLIHDTAAEAVDVKEGAVDGQILDNTIDNAGGQIANRKWIVLRTNGWYIADNTARTDYGGNGIWIYNPPPTGWGSGNIVVRNTATFTATPSGTAGYAVYDQAAGNTVGCSNSYTGTALALSYRTCQP